MTGGPFPGSWATPLTTNFCAQSIRQSPSAAPYDPQPPAQRSGIHTVPLLPSLSGPTFGPHVSLLNAIYSQSLMVHIRPANLINKTCDESSYHLPAALLLDRIRRATVL